jgi:hypothetical protein
MDPAFAVIHHILTVALFREETIEYLKCKGIRTVQHLKLFDISKSGHWVADDLFNDMDAGMLVKVKDWIKSYEIENDGKLPSDWMVEFTDARFFTCSTSDDDASKKMPDTIVTTNTIITTNTLASSLSLESSFSTNDSFDVFASVRVARNKGHLPTDVDQNWRQYTVKPLDSMAQLLFLVLGKIGADVDELQNYPTLVTCHKTPKAELAGRIMSDLSQICKGVISCGYKFIKFRITVDKPSTKVAIIGDAHKKLMSAQNKACCLPDCYIQIVGGKPLPFDRALYNFLVESFGKENLSVRVDQKDKLQRLVFDIRDILQKLHDKVLVKRLASRFHHSLVRKRDRVLCRKEDLASLDSKLVSSMGECAGFLSNTAWANCWVDISALHDLLLKRIEDMET